MTRSSGNRYSGKDSGVPALIEALELIRQSVSSCVTVSSDMMPRLVAQAVIKHPAFSGCAMFFAPDEPLADTGTEATMAKASVPSASIAEASLDMATSVMREGVARQCDNLGEYDGRHYGHLMVVPIKRDGGCDGALAAWNASPRYFEQWHKNLLDLVADIIALAIGRETRRPDGDAERVYDDKRDRVSEFGHGNDLLQAESGEKSSLSAASEIDVLTGMSKSAGFLHRLDRLLAAGGPSPFILFIDIDRFRLITECGGDDVADRVIQVVAGILLRQMDDDCVAGRLGIDEMAVAVHLGGQDEAIQMAQRVVDNIETMNFDINGERFMISVSIGISSPRPGYLSGEGALKQAREACREAQRQGGGHVHFYRKDANCRSSIEDDSRMLNQLTRAFRDDRLLLYAQPIFSLSASQGERTSTALRFELLLRTKDRGGNIYSAGVLLPVAERYGMSAKLDRWVVAETLRELSSLPPEIVERLSFGVNLSGHSIDNHCFLDFVLEAFAATGVAPDRICFEITETAAISDIDAARHFVQALKDIGCEFALDDFGSGHTSFLYLRDLPVDYLKIDGNLVREINRDPFSSAIVRSIHDISMTMGKKTVAEYVESPEILASLKMIGVDFAQGFALGKPKPLRDAIGCLDVGDCNAC